MTGILVTRFKMGQIDVDNLEQMAAETALPERCTAAKNMLDAIRNSPDLLRRQQSLSPPNPPPQK